MKKIEISISSLVKAIIIMLIGLLLVMQTPTYATTGKSTGDVVNVREKPSSDLNVKVVEQLSLNDVVQILGEEGNWYKINYNGTIGYVSKLFISTNNDNIQTSNEQKNEETNNEVNNQDENKIDNQTENQTNNQDNNQTENQTNNQDDNQIENQANNQENETKNIENSEQIVDNEENTSNETPSVTRIYKMADNSKVRILPLITAEEIGEAKKGENVSLVINAGLWVYVKSENVSGWIRIDKLSTEDVVVSNNDNENKKTDEKANSSVEDNKQETTTIESKKMYAHSNAINIRSDANTSSNIVDSIALNTEVTAVGEKNGWYKVQVNGLTGYIRKDLLSNEKTEVTSRSNQLDRAEAQKTAQNSNNTTNTTQNQTTTVANSESSNSVPVSSSGVSGSDIASYAQQFVGCKYVYGASGPNSFDCSGLTSYVYKHFGYTLNRSSKDQAKQGTKVTGELQPGDILVFSNDGKQVGHVGIYIGNDKFVHASDSSTGVIISNLHDRWNINKYWGARRIIQ